jgi:hypothetical protein
VTIEPIDAVGIMDCAVYIVLRINVEPMSSFQEVLSPGLKRIAVAIENDQWMTAA